MIAWEILSTNSVDNFVDIIVKITSKPNYIKLGGFVFAGNYEDPIGTMVLFEEKQDDKPVLSYHCHSNKVLKASRAFLKTKDTDGNKNDNKDVINPQDEEKIHYSSGIPSKNPKEYESNLVFVLLTLL